MICLVHQMNYHNLYATTLFVVHYYSAIENIQNNIFMVTAVMWHGNNNQLWMPVSY